MSENITLTDARTWVTRVSGPVPYHLGFLESNKNENWFSKISLFFDKNKSFFAPGQYVPKLTAFRTS